MEQLIRVKDQGNLFTYLMEHHEPLVADIFGGYIYLKCDENKFKRIMQCKRYYDENKRG